MRPPKRSSWQMALLALALLQSIGCRDNVGPEEVSTVRVSVSVSGLDTDDSFLISLDEGAYQPISSTALLLVLTVPSGHHTLSLGGVGENCDLSSPNPVVIDASPESVTDVTFQVTCTATSGIIAVSVPLPNALKTVWFSVKVDSSAPTWVRANEKTSIGAFSRGVHTVRLSEIPDWCTIQGASSTEVSVSGGGLIRDTTVASFDVNCDAGHGTDNAAIVFQRGESIMLIDEDGGNGRTLTMGVAPSWAADRSFLVFQRPHCQDWGCDDHLWIIRPDGSGERQITETPGFMDYDPVMSPDGRSVAFVRFWNGPDQTYLIVRDVTGSADAVLAIWDPYSTPAWSPDGSQVAFTCEGPSPYWDVDLCVVQRTAGCDTYFVNVCQGRLPAAVHLTSTRFQESAPAWSPDGSTIAFTLACGSALCPPGVREKESYVALLDVVTKRVSLLTPGSGPAWSPSGDRIVYARGGSNPGLYVIDSNGTTKRITDDSRDSNPSWR